MKKTLKLNDNLNEPNQSNIYIKSCFNLGYIYHILDNTEKAIIYLQNCLNTHTNMAIKVKRVLGRVYLKDKCFRKGFKLYCQNLDHSPFYTKIKLPIWDGIESAKNIIIVMDQGYGDRFQFFRFIIDLKEKYTNIHFVCLYHKCRIEHLFDNIIPIINDELDINEFDYKINLTSLPFILGINKIEPYIGKQYIKENENLLLNWKLKLHSLKKYKIGLCWKGNINLNDVINKYIPLELFKDISNLEINLICLQKDAQEELDTISFKNKINYFEIDKDKPFIDTIAILKNIDLLITVDTSVVHLAGLLGVKTILILGFLSEWRWGKEDKKSYWYNSVEIFRSNIANDWKVVLEKVKDRLKELLLTRFIF